jgi:hypothetical protein
MCEVDDDNNRRAAVHAALGDPHRLAIVDDLIDLPRVRECWPDGERPTFTHDALDALAVWVAAKGV